MNRSFRPRAFRLAAAALLAVCTLPAPVAAQDLASFEAKTTVHKLANGWTFLIVERPVSPVFSFATVVNVGAAQEVPGITGLAHMFEHMAFKGSPNIGTTDWEGEKKALTALETAYQAWQAERLSARPDAKKLETLSAEFHRLQEAAARFVVPNEFTDIFTREGGAELNAQTGSDDTVYYYSLPSNKIELFAFLESERFAHPVFRQFYEERDVVQEERRQGVEGSGFGRLREQFALTAFDAHPYGQSGIGYVSDLQSITITDAEKFFQTYYAPSNLTTAIVGDVKAQTLIPILEKYFGRIPARPGPTPLRTVEPEQMVEKTFVLQAPSQPMIMEGYHRPAVTHSDEPVWQAIDTILVKGRTSRLYRSLVRDKKLAVQIGSFANFPGEKYPNLWTVIAVPAVGVGNDQIQMALHAELDRLRSEDVTAEELARVKARAKATLLRGLRSNIGLAFQLAEAQNLYGDWRELFRALDRIDRVTPADIRRVASEAFVPSNRTTGLLVTRTKDQKDAKDNKETSR